MTDDNFGGFITRRSSVMVAHRIEDPRDWIQSPGPPSFNGSSVGRARD